MCFLLIYPVHKLYEQNSLTVLIVSADINSSTNGLATASGIDSSTSSAQANLISETPYLYDLGYFFLWNTFQLESPKAKSKWVNSFCNNCHLA